jgi:hypothetical protein
MRERTWSVFAGICVFALSTVLTAPLRAQTPEVKEKPPLYSYLALWQIPRTQWADVAKSNAADGTILEKALADGTIVGYGNDEVLVHHVDGFTHDNWWSATSLAGLIKVLDQFYASSTITSGVDAASTKHADSIAVSHYYNWHSGAYKRGYVHVSYYKLKADAPDNAVELISKQLVVPLLEKQLASGAILEYEIDTEAVHTEDPAGFQIVYVAASPEGLDAVNAGIQDALKTQPLAGPAFGGITEDSVHRDELLRGEGVFK